MRRNSLIGLSLLLVSFSANSAEVVFTDGQTKILVDYKQGKMFCTHCGYGENPQPITGPIPEFEGSASGVQNYFKEKRLLIVKTSMGISCLAGQYTAIDLNSRTSKDLKLPTCNEEEVTYSTEKGKAIMRIKQGKRVTTFVF